MIVYLFYILTSNILLMRYLLVIICGVCVLSCSSCKTVYYKTYGRATTVTHDTTITEHGSSYYHPDKSVLPDD